MLLIRYCATWISIALLLITSAKADDDHHKRVPSGFTGVRGKKSIPDEAYNSEDVDSNNLVQQVDSSFPQKEPPSSINYDVEKRAPSGFFGMRGKKPWNPDEMYKRAPMGFVGMRGKKENLEDDDYPVDEPLKRAPMGFFGMRGKKYLLEPGFQGDKRAQMGFVGMRGKKEFETPAGYYEDNKRTPSGFFGMRGKKRSYGFFGMRGKKYPYEFRGKFVGVRGKKSSDISIPEDYLLESNLGRLGDDLDINQLMLLLTEQNEDSIRYQQNDKVPSFF